MRHLTNSSFDPIVARRMAALTALRDVARTLALESDLERLLRKVVRAAAQLLDASSGSLLLWQSEEDALIFVVTAGAEAEWLEGRRLSQDQGIAGWILSHREAVMVNDVRQDPRFFNRIDKSLGIDTRSLIGVPLMVQGKVLGVMEVINKRGGEQFDEVDLETLSTLADQAAVAIVNDRLCQQVRRNKCRFIDFESQVYKRLARDFNNGPAQALAGMVMNIEYVQNLMERDLEGAHAELEHIKKAVMYTLEQVRNAIFELRPIVLETKGLVAALREYIIRLQADGAPPIHLHAEGIKYRFPPSVEEASFFIIREAVSNARKHAGFSRMDISLAFQGDELVVLVEDDGRGFDVKKVCRNCDEGGSWGLFNMRECAEFIGGRLYVGSTPGQGTSVTLVVPINTDAESYAGMS
jgi:signal transduction histidine kinase